MDDFALRRGHITAGYPAAAGLAAVVLLVPGVRVPTPTAGAGQAEPRAAAAEQPSGT